MNQLPPNAIENRSAPADFSPRPAHAWVPVLYWLPALLYAVLIFVLSSMPGEALASEMIWRFDKLIHCVEYAVLAVLLLWALRGSERRNVSPAMMLIVVALATAYGATDEWHQSFTPGRFSSLHDLAADCAGAALGAMAYLLWSRRAAK